MLRSLSTLLVAACAVGALVALAARCRRLARELVAARDAQLRLQRAAVTGMLTAGFAHEMKNALTVVLGFAELARTTAERTLSEPRVTQHLHELERQSRRSVEQLRHFLAFASGEVSPFVSTDLGALLRDALVLIQPMARMRDLQLEEHDLAEPFLVHCDPHAIRQVALNLLLNATEFARSRIDVGVRSQGDFVELRVVDDGPGISRELATHLFQPFASARPGGSGLGLATSRTLAEQAGGTLDLAPTSPESPSGATFVLRLPSARP